MRKKPQEYLRRPKCPHCGCTDLQDVEKARRQEQLKKNTCHCSSYPFKHVAGSLRMCVEHPSWGEEPCDSELEAYQGVIATERGAF